jgi:hypothetical protein
MCGKPSAALLNLLLCVLSRIPGVVHAFIVINQTENDKRTEKIMRKVAAEQMK